MEYHERYMITKTLDGCIVDVDTGEILSEVEKVKSVPVTEPIREFLSEDDLKQWCKSHSVKGSSKLRSYFDMLDKDLPKSEFVPFLVLSREVKYLSTLFIDRARLCKIFECTGNNLNRKLNKLVKKGLLKYKGTGLMCSTNSVRIDLNPVYVFKGSDNYRAMFIRNWYSIANKNSDTLHLSADLTELSKITDKELEDFRKTLLEDFETIYEKAFNSSEVSLKTFNKIYESYFDKKTNKSSVKHKILNCTDVDFKLFCLGVLSVDELRTY